MAKTARDRVFIQFIKTSRAVTKYYDAYLHKRMRLSEVKIAVLTVLKLYGVMKPSEIAAHTCTERNNITTLLRRMSREGLIRTQPNIKDKRSLDVMLTDRGKDVFEMAKPIPLEVRDHILTSINRTDLGLLEDQLKTMSQNAMSALEMMNRKHFITPPVGPRKVRKYPISTGNYVKTAR